MNVRDKIKVGTLEMLQEKSFESLTTATICRAAGVSNGSFFHLFPSKDMLGAELFLTALVHYHNAMMEALRGHVDAERAIDSFIHAHLGWVVEQEVQARLLFEEQRRGWAELLGDRQAEENARFAEAIGIWRSGVSDQLWPMSDRSFVAQIVGPCQIPCRAWLGGRSREDPRALAKDLSACAIRACCRSTGQ